MALCKAHPFAFEVETVKVDCFICGGPVKGIVVQKGTRPPPKMCSDCRDIDEDGLDGPVYCREQIVGFKFVSRAKCRIIKKGTKEWREIVANIRPRREHEQTA